jgi:predicted HicB family RNase H-like nuclease
MLPDHTHYAYRVLWSPEDEEYVALCAEFPSMSWLEDSPAAALDGMMNLVRDTIADMEANGEQIPQPLSERAYSGKFMVRVSPDLHARLAREAAEQNVSLNRLANERLSAPVPARMPAPEPAAASPWPGWTVATMSVPPAVGNLVYEVTRHLDSTVLELGLAVDNFQHGERDAIREWAKRRTVDPDTLKKAIGLKR